MVNVLKFYWMEVSNIKVLILLLYVMSIRRKWLKKVYTHEHSVQFWSYDATLKLYISKISCDWYHNQFDVNLYPFHFH